MKTTTALILAVLFAVASAQFCCSQTNGSRNPLTLPPNFGPPGFYPPRFGPSGFGPPGLGVPPATRWNGDRRIDLRLPTFELATNFIVAEVVTGAEIPDQIALVVKRLPNTRMGATPSLADLPPEALADPKKVRAAIDAQMSAIKARQQEEEADWDKAQWVPYAKTLPIDLGPGDGQRMLWIGARWGSGENQAESASGIQVVVERSPPLIVITNPVERVTSRPMIQLQGYSDRSLSSIRYDLVNASKRVEDQEGFVNHQVVDMSVVGFLSTNFFTCYDVDLAQGTNTIVLRCEDHFGNVATNILTFVFTLEGDHTPPVISTDRPLVNEQLAGDSFTARGRLDDPTSRIVGVVVANGTTNTIEGLVERNGYFWVEQIPLLPGENRLTLTATDAAGNSSTTNLVVFKLDAALAIVIDPIPPDHLWHTTVRLTGRVTPPNYDIWVNGVQAVVASDGRWVATNVPTLSPNGGTVVFDATAIPRNSPASMAAGAGKPAQPSPTDWIEVQSALSTNSITLNATRPSCGTFNLRLTGTAGSNFILLASTNLVEWTPILTNRISEAMFNYTTTNTAQHPCQFFRVVPLN